MGEGDSDVAGHRLERGEITLDFFLSSLGDVEKEAWAILHPDSKKFFGDSLQPKPEMHDFVTEIKKGGFKTGLISNNVKEWQPAWDKVIPTRDLFDATIFSSEVGCRKPNSEIFNIALHELDVQPHEAIFLDDFPQWLKEPETQVYMQSMSTITASQYKRQELCYKYKS